MEEKKIKEVPRREDIKWHELAKCKLLRKVMPTWCTSVELQEWVFSVKFASSFIAMEDQVKILLERLQ